jgi:polar amino acid transport system substrate-binding protein
VSFVKQFAALVGFVALFFVAPALAEQASIATRPEHITYLTEDYPPSNFVENGELKGYATDLLKAMWRQMKVPAQPIEVTNWARAYNQLETVPNTMLFATSRTSERENKFLWVGPIVKNRYVLIGRTDRKYDVATPTDAAKYRVGVIRDDIGQKLLAEAGLSEAKLDKVADFRQLVKMLKADRIDLICASSTVLPTFVNYGDFKANDLQQVITVKNIELYYAFNKDTNSHLIERFQAALKAVEPERKRVLTQFGLTP